MTGYYKMDAVPLDLYEELRWTAFELGISRTVAFAGLLGKDVRSVVRHLAAGQARLARSPANGGKRLAMVLPPEAKARLDEAARRTGIKLGVAGAMILAAHQGKMEEALRECCDAG
jgi:hypothetical protein